MSPMPPALTPDHRRQFDEAVWRLEHPSFAARLADYAGQPINSAIKYLPGAVNRRLRDAVRAAIFKCLEVAVGSLDRGDGSAPSDWTGKLVTGLTGGIGGFFGLVALPIELPLTTTLMLRNIAEIARTEGEDLQTLEAQLACLEVFALGGRSQTDKADVDYYAVRTVLSKLTADMAAYVMERGAIKASSPIVARLVGEIVSRFGLIVTERVAAGAVPLIGAVGGATVNMVFMDHFQRVARGHFTVRRLERVYGIEPIQGLYHQEIRRHPPKGRRQSASRP